jgi:hypothetical protein
MSRGSPRLLLLFIIKWVVTVGIETVWYVVHHGLPVPMIKCAIQMHINPKLLLCVILNAGIILVVQTIEGSTDNSI